MNVTPDGSIPGRSPPGSGGELGGPGRRATLSLVLITLDEADNLPRCIASVADLADEILLVDSGSTDGTLELARAAGARVLHRAFDGYGPQKQFALEQARGEWLLCLDADEWLDAAARDSLRHWLEQGAAGSPVTGLRLRRDMFYLGRRLRFGAAREKPKLRLARRGHARWDAASVHESLRLRAGMEGRLAGRLLHRPYRDLGHHLAKIDRYTRLIAERDRHLPLARLLFGVSLEPGLVFLHRYLVQGGCLDGPEGFVHCAMTAFYFFLRHARILLRRRHPGAPDPP